MPTLRCGKVYECLKKQEAQVTICSQDAVPINIPSKNQSPKITATGESLFSIHKKIQRHLTGTKLLTKFDVRKLMLILNRMHCPSPMEHEIMMTAQNILAQINRRITAENTPYRNGASMEQDSTELTDTSSLEKYETLCSAISNLVTNNSNSLNNMSLLSKQNDETSQNLYTESANLSEETGNELFNSQSDIIKLRFNDVEAYGQVDGSLSFPLELLTNNDFVISQKNVNSGLMNQKETCTGNDTMSNTENAELQEDASAVNNNSSYNEDTLYDERIVDNNTQVNLPSNEYSCKITPEISSSKIPESNNQVKVSKNMAFEINAKDILTISSFTTNTPPPSFEAFEKMMSNADTAISSDRTELDGSNFSRPLTENISFSAQKIYEDSPCSEDPSQRVVDYNSQLTQIPDTRKNLHLEGANSEKGNVGISQATDYDLNDSNSPEIIFIDCQTTNPQKNNIDDDVEISDPNNGTFPNCQSQAIKSGEYAQLTFPDSVWKDSQNKIYQAVVYDLDKLNSAAPTPHENSAINSSLQKFDKENANKSSLPRDKFDIKQSARRTFVKTNDVLPIPSECPLGTDTINLETNVADDVAIITNLAKQQNNGVNNKIIDQSDNESFVFNLERINSAIDVIEATPSPKLKQEPPLKHKTKKSESIMDNSETEDIIIEETAYTRSESAIFKTHSVEKYGISSPYKSQAQSSSFLNYKSHAKSPRCISSRRRSSGMASSVGGSLPPAEAQSKNILMINGEIPKRQDRMESTSIEAKEESFSEKQAKLQEKVMRKRDAYRTKWKDIPLTEKISSKFIQKFHVRIFEDPVNSLTNIDYKPSFNTFHFTRLTINEINEEMKSTWEMSKKIDDALTKAISSLQGRSTNDWASAFLRSSTDELDSDDSSDEEIKANNKWLIEYIQKAQNETNVFNDEICKEIRNVESERRNTWDNNAPADDEGRDEELENLLRKLADFDWLIE